MVIFKNFVNFEFFVFKETFWIKIYLLNKKFFVSFLDFEQNLFGLLTQSFRARFPDLQLRVHSNVFLKNNVCEKKDFFLHLSLFLSGIFPYFRRTFYGRVDKSAFYMSRGQLMENKLFEQIELTSFIRILSDLLLRFGKKLQQKCQKKSHYMLGEHFEQNHLFWKKSTITDFFQTASEKFSAGFFKKIFRCFQRKLFTEKKHFL